MKLLRSKGSALTLALIYVVMGPFLAYAMARGRIPTGDELAVFCILFYILASAVLYFLLYQCLKFCDGEESCIRNCVGDFLFWWWPVVLITFFCIVYSDQLPA